MNGVLIDCHGAGKMGHAGTRRNTGLTTKNGELFIHRWTQMNTDEKHEGGIPGFMGRVGRIAIKLRNFEQNIQ